MRFFQSTHLLFLLVDLHVHHKDWQTLLVDLIDMVNSYNFKWSQMTLILLSQMALLRWLTQLDSWLWLSQSFSFGFIFCCNTSICYTMAFPPLGNSDHVVISVSIYWLSVPLKNGSLVSLHSFWLLLCWLGWSLWSFERCSMREFFNLLFKLGASSAPKDCSRWVQAGTDVYISQWKYQVTLFHLHVFQLLFLQS